MIRLKKEYKKALAGYKFVDLFCGIGGFHAALKDFGAECVFASDINLEAQKIYRANFRIEPKGDIRDMKEVNIPKHDILCAGFPCQAFSISGSQQGFNNVKSGRLFYEIIRIAEYHKSKLILLENVANIEFHDNGKTIDIIISELHKIGYRAYKQSLNAADYNVPQSRKRLYIVAFRENMKIREFRFPEHIKLKRNVEAILEAGNSESARKSIINREYHIRDSFEVIEKECKKPCIRIGEIGLGRQGERIYSIKGCATTLSASGGGVGGRTGIYLINNQIRKLTPRECARLMGFPDKFVIAETPNQAYQQFGNSVVVDVLQHIIIEVIKTLLKESCYEK
ncbi:MAG: DNA cytosine methyltransferase [Firmicutes bacterium]|nr:DNA cytosine methyltransferase [Bacillota bacterium]